MEMWLALWPWVLLGGAIGSIPFGLLLARLAGAGDIRAIGSGNIGATNVLRTGRKGLAAATLLLDIGKGAVAVLLARHFGGEFGGEGVVFAAGGGAVLGHIYSPWLRFRGGKGVATLLGVSAALLFWAGIGFALGWLVAVLVTRISSLGGMSGGFVAAAVAWGVGEPQLAVFLLTFALLLLWTHRENIRRLVAGTEPRIGRKG